MTMESRNYKIELLTDLLGTVPKNKDVYSDFVIKKALEEGLDVIEEVNTVEEIAEKGWTGFHTDADGIFIYDYLIKGNIKANLETLIMSGDVVKIPAYKHFIDKVLFVYPRRIRLKAVPDGVNERPIRAQTAQGPRVSLIKSDYVCEGTTIEFEIRVISNPKITWEVIEKAMELGQYYGLGQWRGSGGYGRYVIAA